MGHIKEKVQQIMQTEIGKKVIEKMDERALAELDTDTIMMKQVEELENEKRLLVARLKAQEKKMDHMERAKRKAEIPLMKEAKDNFMATLLTQRKAQFEKKLKEYNKMVEEQRAMRMEDRKIQRKEERRQKYFREKEEEEQRRRDEELKRIREEKAREEAERKAKEEEEYQKK